MKKKFKNWPKYWVLYLNLNFESKIRVKLEGLDFESESILKRRLDSTQNVENMYLKETFSKKKKYFYDDND